MSKHEDYWDALRNASIKSKGHHIGFFRIQHDCILPFGIHICKKGFLTILN